MKSLKRYFSSQFVATAISIHKTTLYIKTMAFHLSESQKTCLTHV